MNIRNRDIMENTQCVEQNFIRIRNWWINSIIFANNEICWKWWQYICIVILVNLRRNSVRQSFFALGLQKIFFYLGTSNWKQVQKITYKSSIKTFDSMLLSRWLPVCDIKLLNDIISVIQIISHTALRYNL